ncbi:class I SAM-dependent methyltransferase [Rhodoplanes azumiensis]|uniref:Class I SAM-dependent methyltransferase n=1 Tax=Rhodoplanes azumiensis TaxID=1897628 RepID=A0ABW5AR66_9BRAD
MSSDRIATDADICLPGGVPASIASGRTTPLGGGDRGAEDTRPRMAAGIDFTAEQIHHSACQICGGPIGLLFEKTTRTATFSIVRCADCGFAFVNPTPSEDAIVAFYTQAGCQENSLLSLDAVTEAERIDPITSREAKRIVGRMRDATRGRRFLDVGCGYGQFSAEARRHGFSVDVIEVAATERTIATELLGFAPTAVTFECHQADHAYDAILMSHVLEHSREPVKWLRKAASLLSDGGIAAIAVPNFGSIVTDVLGKNDPFVTPPAHLNYFAPRNLARAAEVAGLRMLRVETVTYIPKRSFSRRLGRAAGLASHRLFHTVASPVLDGMKKGTVLNMYLGRAA